MNKTILTEGIAVHGYAMAAYVYVIAEQYAAIPKLDPSAVPLWMSMAAHDDKMLKRIMGDVEVEFVEEDPYPTLRAMLFDIFKNKRMKIYKTTDDGSQEGAHPALSNAQNDAFRAVHDMVGHYGPNAKIVAKYIVKNNIESADDPMLKKMPLRRNAFNVRGEMNTYVSHCSLLPAETHGALFTEIVGQICTFFTTGNYTHNKVAIIDGVDFKNVGVLTDPELVARAKKYEEFLRDPSVEEFTLEKMPITIKKADIRWRLLGSLPPRTDR